MRDIIFRARRKDTGEWVEGNYTHNKRKGTFHLIRDFDHNKEFYVYRESLQMKDYDGVFKDITEFVGNAADSPIKEDYNDSPI